VCQEQRGVKGCALRDRWVRRVATGMSYVLRNVLEEEAMGVRWEVTAPSVCKRGLVDFMYVCT
jgi:hypothetical protein